MSDFETLTREHARLIILRALAARSDGRMNSAMLQDALDAFAISQSRDWVHQELRYLAEVGAVTVADAGTVRVATLTQAGQDHVDRRRVLEGVRKPSPSETIAGAGLSIARTILGG